MNWGKGIVIGMAVFMLFILTLGARMMTTATDDYDHAYYEKGLTFDVDYRKELQVVNDHAQPVVSLKNGIVSIQFKDAAAGKVNFIRQSDRNLDRACQFKTGTGNVYLLKTPLPAKGHWQIVADWQSNGKAYLYQQQLWVP